MENSVKPTPLKEEFSFTDIENKFKDYNPPENSLDYGVNMIQGLEKLHNLFFHESDMLFKKIPQIESSFIKTQFNWLNSLKAIFKSIAPDNDGYSSCIDTVLTCGEVFYGSFKTLEGNVSEGEDKDKANAILDYLWTSYKNILESDFYISILDIEDKKNSYNSYKFNNMGGLLDPHDDNMATINIGYARLPMNQNEYKIIRRGGVFTNPSYRRKAVSPEARQWLEDALKEIHKKNDSIPISKEVRQDHLQKFSQFTQEYLKEKGYEKTREEYKQELKKLIDQDASFTGPESQVETMIAKALSALSELKGIYRVLGKNLTDEQFKKSFAYHWIDPFLKKDSFPLKGNDKNTTLLKNQLKTAFFILCDIELMKERSS